ncbi:MAG TPA: hypothetical protein EYP17_10180 [Candidatus Latescibacteria bacterium]|nr:hypothetical protein [Candidatus Latescibacterota bacterium]
MVFLLLLAFGVWEGADAEVGIGFQYTLMVPGVSVRGYLDEKLGFQGTLFWWGGEDEGDLAVDLRWLHRFDAEGTVHIYTGIGGSVWHEWGERWESVRPRRYDETRYGAAAFWGGEVFPLSQLGVNLEVGFRYLSEGRSGFWFGSGILFYLK